MERIGKLNLTIESESIKSMKKIYFGIVKQGKFKPDEPEAFIDIFKLNEGKRLEITVERFRLNRSLKENSYYWACPIKVLADYLGYTSDEMHEALKWLFLRIHREGKPDTVKSTTSLTTMEFEEYLEKIRIWASSDLGCVIPLPNEIDF